MVLVWLPVVGVGVVIAVAVVKETTRTTLTTARRTLAKERGEMLVTIRSCES